ncbi:ANKRD17 [Symbiodinium necroappetens]|uniref:ANKRD17 protein n=1 Tax=Symbiodinium necroappetens TaxID=1628268 RepID=A0A812JW89_9DINO|nr:ANKRD17 [Symbiodinium necroappetens]
MPLRIGSDVPFTSTSPGEAFTDSSLDGDPIRVHKRLGPPWLQDVLHTAMAPAVDLQLGPYLYCSFCGSGR